VADTGLGHDGDGDCGHDVLDHPWVGHAGNAALDADIGGDTLQRHDGAGSGLLGDAGLWRGLSVAGLRWNCRVGELGGGRRETHLLCVDDVHDDAALEHTG
jgi:hypothetical protein